MPSDQRPSRSVSESTQMFLGVGERLLPMLSGRIAPDMGLPAYGKQQSREKHGVTFDQYSPALANIHKSGLFDKLCDLDLKSCLGGEIHSLLDIHSMRGEPVRLGWKLRRWLANCNGWFSDFSDTLKGLDNAVGGTVMGEPFEEAAYLTTEIILGLSKCVRHRLYLPKAAQHRLEECKQAFQEAADSPATFEAIALGTDADDMWRKWDDAVIGLSGKLTRGLRTLLSLASYWTSTIYLAKLNQWQGAHSSLCLPPDLAVGNPAEASPGSSRQQLSVLVQLQAEALSSPKSNTAAPAIIPPVSSAYPPLPTDNCRQHRRRHRQRQRRRRSEWKSEANMNEKGRDWTRCRETGVWKDPPVGPALHEGGKQLLTPMLAQVTQLKSQLALLEMDISQVNLSQSLQGVDHRLRYRRHIHRLR